ncbi:hypothetical protein GCM10011594_44090 [Nakamurella endophytica]|uniref:Uncharacterized protein n=1 Tax=Nakamurella endophytica TaxID=1748367 RepID=A0A917TDB5_9ACTN|nr:hypothetical protein GCM10011594_44090 [Nakamurella endophytica]
MLTGGILWVPPQSDGNKQTKPRAKLIEARPVLNRNVGLTSSSNDFRRTMLTQLVMTARKVRRVP